MKRSRNAGMNVPALGKGPDDSVSTLCTDFISLLKTCQKSILHDFLILDVPSELFIIDMQTTLRSRMHACILEMIFYPPSLSFSVNG